ncbi:MAG: M28 family peptidase [Corallococcus sp.]|nr:M28 family peptidase [Corallococcus sp.]MCM1359194.1 M28 family peptidase [Corallococcus sp.]MCM1394584.1 M28 family peptidase [Corallococcus sp.]
MKLNKIFPVWGKKKTIITCTFLAMVIALSILIGALNITVTYNTSSREYSVDALLSHVYAISRKEHSIYDEDNSAEVRGYISSTLYGYGIENETIKHRTRYAFNEKINDMVPYAPKNIYAEIAGESGTNILLICHYDSCPYKIKYDEASEGSHGAIDDGYGVAVVLELARIYATETGLKNGIKLAFVDAEEEGTLGSESLVEEYGDWLADVNLVLNVESRGETGPVYLFQTSPNNRKLIDFYKNAGCPYTFSLAADVYDMMPNDTDLSPFIEKGFAGLNVATLDSLKTYHNEKDVFENIDVNTLAKYCDTLLPLVDEYVLQEKYSDMNYFEGDGDALFFTLFPNALVVYGDATGWAFFGVTLALVTALVSLLIWKKRINIVKTLISLAVDLGLLAVICGLGFVVALISCAIAGVNFHLIFVIGVSADIVLLILFGIVSASAAMVSAPIKQRLGINYTESSVGSLLIYAVLCVVCVTVIFGGSFVFVIPAFLSTIALSLSFVKKNKLRQSLAGVSVAITALFTLSLGLSLTYSLYVSLTFGALGFLLVLIALPFTLLAPQIFGFYDEPSVATDITDKVEVNV